MKNNNNNDSTKKQYIDAALHMLDQFKTNVIEVHHIGSTSFEYSNMNDDIDILLIMKSQQHVSELPDVLIAEGYEIIHDFSPYYEKETVVRGEFNGFIVNFIFMADGEERKREILNSKITINDNDEYLQRFVDIKRDYENGRLDAEEYQSRKDELFLQLGTMSSDVKIV